ncbi:choice-of-anchor Q domain-containing protein [Meiothermus ruber]|uniref:choice-of-anchor Q domain-containing protein n=1 Tax=Meiothermus ruber TaxID=277 RepID=UPI000A452A43|nr:choice-of-anchor Q domain-containing protein [Meiothermus ruber]
MNGGPEQDIAIQPTQSGNIIFWIPLVSGSNTAVIRVYDAEGLSASATLNLQVGGSSSGGSGGGSFGTDYGGYTLPSGPTYYVSPSGSNANDGSRARPWATLSFAGQKLKPGDVLRVLPGSYNESVPVTASGTSSPRITIASDIRWGPKLNAQGNLFGIDVRGSYVDSVGFEVTNAPNSGIISWAPYNRFLFNHVYGIRAQCDSNGGAGVNMSSPDSSDGVMLGNLVHDIGDLSAGFCTRIHGIYQGAPRGLVQNNITYRARGFGITSWHAATAVTISNNLSFANLYGGISVGSGDNTRGNRAENFLVANNIVVGNPRGISEEGNTGVNRFVNNLVWNNTTNWRLQTSTQQGSLSLDPGFVNFQPDGSGNYTLQSSSPAIDKGITERAPAIDFQAKPRLQGSAPDLGPFEVR